MKNRIWKLGWQIRRAGGVDIVLAHAPGAGASATGTITRTWASRRFCRCSTGISPAISSTGHVHMEYGRDIARVLRRGDTTIINAYERYTLEV